MAVTDQLTVLGALKSLGGWQLSTAIGKKNSGNQLVVHFDQGGQIMFPIVVRIRQVQANRVRQIRQDGSA